MLDLIRVASFDCDIEITHQPGPDDFVVSILAGGALVATVRASHREGMRFIAPVPGRCQRHYLQVRGTFIDVPPLAWEDLRDWYDVRDAAAMERRESAAGDLPAITAPVALGAAA